MRLDLMFYTGFTKRCISVIVNLFHNSKEKHVVNLYLFLCIIFT